MQILRTRDRTTTPWKNGGGTTHEVAIWPPAALWDTFAWRVSIAEVAASGPFSSFPAIDRVLTVIQGSGLDLNVAGQGPITMNSGSAPYHFAGDATCDARLGDGPIRDINVMSRRGVATAEVRRETIRGRSDITATRTFALLVALDPLSIGPNRDLHIEDATLLLPGESLVARAREARALLIEIDLVANR